MSRISEKFSVLRQKGQTGFIAYISAGDPDLETTKKLVLDFEKRGVDIVEFGVPFSDPLADGPVNQEAAQRALKHNVSLGDVLRTVGELREETEMPIVLFTYFNPVFRYGLERFVAHTGKMGVDGVLLLDVPPEESGDYKGLMDAREVDTVFLVSPTSTDQRIKLISEYTTGFVYYVSRTGVTGEKDSLEASVRPMVNRIRKHTDQPIAVGFGISNPEHVREVAGYADAVVVGSAIVRRIGAGTDDPSLVEKVGAFVGTLTAPLKEARPWI